jgi:thiamine-phosphate pyrophosphorylase
VTLSRPIVGVVSDRSRLPPPAQLAGDEPSLDALIERLALTASAGADFLQIREPDLSAAALATAVARLRAAAGDAPARILVNDRLDVALAAGADGVHLKAESIPTALVRRHVPAGFLVGRSVHDPEAARAAEADGADFVIFGTVFPSGSKPAGHRAAGLDALAATAAAVRIPVVAIGGISLNTAAAAAAAGAAGVAAIGLFFDAAGEADDLRGRLVQTVAGLRRAFAPP